jgi:tyrosyl-tRNA synthetase
MFGKLMSISDELMWRYYLLLTDVGEAEIAALRDAAATGARHPKEVKTQLAAMIVTEFHGAAAAAGAAARFEARFSRGELDASQVPEVAIEVPPEGLALTKVLTLAGLAESASDGSRKILQGGVRMDRQRVGDPRRRIGRQECPFVLEAGRRAVRVVATERAGGEESGSGTR